MENWLLEISSGLITFLLVFIAVKVDRKNGHITPKEKRLRKKWEEEKAAEEAAKAAAQAPAQPRHYMSQSEYEQYKREHGIK